VNTTETRKFPLWKEWIEQRGESMGYGDAVTSKEMAEALGEKEESLQFNMAIMEIRKWFRRRGMNFTSRGLKGSGFVIAKPGLNAWEIERMWHAALSSMKEALILGTTTPLELLNSEERRIHEAKTAKMAMRLALISRKQNQPQHQIQTADHPLVKSA
jgi:hypothetical protein